MRKTEVLLPLSTFADLDRTGPVPLYYQVSQRIQQAILGGQLPPGSRLENEIALGDRLGLSRPTIRKAIQELVDKGLLVRRRGVGTQVVHGQVTRGVELTSLHDDLIRSGKKPSTKLLSLEVLKADSQVAEELAVAPGTEIIRIERLRYADSIPVSVMVNYLPGQFRGISVSDLEELGLYQWLRLQGITIRVAKQKISARKASNKETDLLELENGAALLTMDRTAYDDEGRAIEYGHHCYSPELYSFQATLVQK
ncbi:GntR family transcriptional regulator [Aquiluna borgnonia]|jgi:DNA-binding GntR family transcriptional regulator|uniref:GntR family transcriptional regulator n=1 Tax=Aquiluna borgnonia TaxID=2499157 RepID=A0A7D4PR17_9MICO|nr:GntR family transcriptional regulator [Aquiluna borgnonia]QKJ25686.1 GntR family transcriptional regulator [Aquiluna borgnonia]